MSGKWFLRRPAQDVAGRLFCLPYSGCGATMYRAWPERVGELGICPVQLPGRENRMRERPHLTYQALADDLADALLPYMDRRYALFGHCGSALAAYETAVRITERGYPLPARVFVSSEVAPQDGPYGRFLSMTDEELAGELRALMTQMGGTPRPDLIDLALEVLRADVEANKRYHINEPTVLPCPLTAIGWSRDWGVEPQLMAGWSACGATTFELLDGDHYRFLVAPSDLMDLLARDTLGRTSLTTGGETAA